jgi:hypothetical protein
LDLAWIGLDRAGSIGIERTVATGGRDVPRARRGDCREPTVGFKRGDREMAQFTQSALRCAP